MSEDRIRYIYCITNQVNGKNYFGQHTMRKGYKTELADVYWGSGTLLKRAQKKYGLENFKKEIIISGKFSKEQINRFERCIIAIQRLIGKAEYNIAYGGDGGFTGFWGTDLCSESKRRKQGQYIKDLLSKLSEEERKEFYRKRTEKTLITWQQNGTKHETFKGKHHSEETKNKIRESRKGKCSGSKNGSFGKHWFTNGVENIKCENCPEGFWPGRVNCNHFNKL